MCDNYLLFVCCQVRIHTCEYDPAVVGRLKRFPCPKEQCVRTFFTKQEANFHSRHCNAKPAKEWEHTTMLTTNHRYIRPPITGI